VLCGGLCTCARSSRTRATCSASPNRGHCVRIGSGGGGVRGGNEKRRHDHPSESDNGDGPAVMTHRFQRPSCRRMRRRQTGQSTRPLVSSFISSSPLVSSFISSSRLVSSFISSSPLVSSAPLVLRSPAFTLGGPHASIVSTYALIHVPHFSLCQSALFFFPPHPLCFITLIVILDIIFRYFYRNATFKSKNA